MLGRLHIIVFLLICLISSALGGGLAMGILQYFYASTGLNAFIHLIATLTFIPLGFLAPSVVLFSIRKEQKQSLREFYAEQTRRERQMLSLNEQDEVGGELIDADQDYYAALRVDMGASQAEIEQSYYDILDELSAKGENSEIASIQAAYAVLGDHEARVKYDLARLLKQNGANLNAPARKRRVRRPKELKVSPISLASVTGGFLLFVGGAVLSFVSLELFYGKQFLP